MPRDVNQRAASILDAIDALTDGRADAPQDGKDPERVERGKFGGSKGGKLRAERLSPERRSEIARQAAVARWRKGEDQA